MPGGSVRIKQACGGNNLAKRNNWNSNANRGDGWRNPKVAHLTNSAGGFLVVVGVRVWNNLNKKK